MFNLDRCEVGDVAHLTRFNQNECDIWALCTRRIDDRPHFVLLDAQAYGYAEGEDSENWTMNAAMDTGRVVPEDEVPDHVWAAIARRALLGEVP